MEWAFLLLAIMGLVLLMFVFFFLLDMLSGLLKVLGEIRDKMK